VLQRLVTTNSLQNLLAKWACMLSYMSARNVKVSLSHLAKIVSQRFLVRNFQLLNGSDNLGDLGDQGVNAKWPGPQKVISLARAVGKERYEGASTTRGR
jgi:hypothetical protein